MKVLIVSSMFLCLLACGIAPPPTPPTPVPDSSIVGGQPTAAHSEIASHIVAILGSNIESDYLCTGVLIGPNLILTAAHCALDMQSGEAVFSTNLSTTSTKDRRPIERVVIQPRFPATLKRIQKQSEKNSAPTRIKNWGDLALVWFTGNLPTGYSPVQIGDGNSLTDGQTVVLAGYGQVDGRAQTSAQGLNQVEAPILKAKYSRSEFSLDQSNHKGVCHGDSGGPAFIEQDNEILLMGITSRGSDATCERLSIFTRVSSFKAWIKKSTAQ
jgi:secreted trypsin-like serine protease